MMNITTRIGYKTMKEKHKNLTNFRFDLYLVIQVLLIHGFVDLIEYRRYI